MNTIQHNISEVQINIQDACSRGNRDSSTIQLIAVSKKQPINRIHSALDAGHRLYGENRVQEATKRWSELKLKHPDLCLHLIGPLQTNKVKDAIALFDVIETVDRSKLAKALAKEMKLQNKNIPCFIQVNTGDEEQKSGVSPEELPDLLKLCEEQNLNITGLMCIPPQNDLATLHFAFLTKLAKRYNLPNLSMGMSSDFEKAIPLGATHVRIGSAIFGERITVK